jgi:hypothetical protein
MSRGMLREMPEEAMYKFKKTCSRVMQQDQLRGKCKFEDVARLTV